MSRHFVIRAMGILACVVALASLAFAAPASRSGMGPAAAVGLTTAGGGRYRLDSGPWLIQGTAAGSGYRLEVVPVPAGAGTPCCCTFVPCMLRSR